MSKLMNQVTALRESMRSADAADKDSFSEVFSAFFELTETSDLMDASNPTDDKGIGSLIETVARRHTGNPTLVVTGLQMLHHAPSGLFHGAFFAGREAGTFFYFLEEQQGIVAFSADLRTMHYYRITATELPPGTMIGRKRPGIN